jgi:hypothetical protein
MVVIVRPMPMSAGWDVRQTPKLQTVAVTFSETGEPGLLRIVVTNSFFVPPWFAGVPPGADQEMLV